MLGLRCVAAAALLYITVRWRRVSTLLCAETPPARAFQHRAMRAMRQVCVVAGCSASSRTARVCCGAVMFSSASGRRGRTEPMACSSTVASSFRQLCCTAVQKCRVQNPVHSHQVRANAKNAHECRVSVATERHVPRVQALRHCKRACCPWSRQPQAMQTPASSTSVPKAWSLSSPRSHPTAALALSAQPRRIAHCPRLLAAYGFISCTPTTCAVAAK